MYVWPSHLVSEATEVRGILMTTHCENPRAMIQSFDTMELSLHGFCCRKLKKDGCIYCTHGDVQSMRKLISKQVLWSAHHPVTAVVSFQEVDFCFERLATHGDEQWLPWNGKFRSTGIRHGELETCPPPSPPLDLNCVAEWICWINNAVDGEH